MNRSAPSPQKKGLGWAVLLVAVSALFGAGLSIRFSEFSWIEASFATAALLAIHWMFFRMLLESLTDLTPRGRLLRNLGWYPAFIAGAICIYAALYIETGLRDGASGLTSHDPWTCAFFSVITWTTVGYGDVTAVTSAARFVAAAEALNGAVVMAVFIAALVATFQRLLTLQK